MRGALEFVFLVSSQVILTLLLGSHASWTVFWRVLFRFDCGNFVVTLTIIHTDFSSSYDN